MCPIVCTPPSIISQNSFLLYSPSLYPSVYYVYYYPCLSGSFLDIGGSFKFAFPLHSMATNTERDRSLTCYPIKSCSRNKYRFAPFLVSSYTYIPGISLSYNPTCSGAAVSGLLLFVYIVDSIWGSTENINSSRGGG